MRCGRRPPAAARRPPPPEVSAAAQEQQAAALAPTPAAVVVVAAAAEHTNCARQDFPSLFFSSITIVRSKFRLSALLSRCTHGGTHTLLAYSTPLFTIRTRPYGLSVVASIFLTTSIPSSTCVVAHQSQNKRSNPGGQQRALRMWVSESRSSRFRGVQVRN